MTEPTTRSPRRAHILSSINPDEPRRSTRSRSRSPKPRRARPAAVQDDDTAGPRPSRSKSPSEDHRTDNKPRRSRLKLKDENSRRRRRRHERERESSLSRPSRRDRPRHHDRSPSRRHRHRSRRTRSPTPPNPHDPEPLDAETAFRESLFDALADDEGAAYWEGVYGQPIHIYDEPTAESGSGRRGGPQTLEQMTEEEYAAYVRQKMWEKTHAGIMEERARQAERQKARKTQERAERQKREEVDRAVRQEEEERLRRRWEKRFTEYTKRWEDVPTSSKPGVRHASAETILPWPVDSGRREDIDEDAVRRFFVQGLGLGEMGESAFAKKIKEERIRWHPDKIQQRLGGQVEDVVMKDVTFIFQVIDRVWSEMRSAAS